MAKLNTNRSQLRAQSIHRFTAIATASAIATLITSSTSFAINGGNGGGDSTNYPRNVQPMLSDSPEPGMNAADGVEKDSTIPSVYVSGQRTHATIHQTETNNNGSQTDGSNSGSSNGNSGGGKTASNNKNKKPGEGQCSASEILDKTCQQTYDWIENAALTNTISQVGGSAVVGATNQVGAMKAQSAGTQSAVMSAAANSQAKAGALQTAVGLGNTAAGAYQIMLSRQHKQIGETELKNDLNQSQAAASVGGVSATGNPETIQKAIKEQKAVERAAMMAGVKSVITGVTQTLSGALAIGAAKQAKDLASKLSDVTGGSYQLTSNNPDTGSTLPTSTTALSTGTATDPAVATTDTNTAGGDVPSIDTPTNPDNPNNGPGAGPMAGSFQPGSAKGANGGGGSGGIGVGSMSPAKAEQEQTGPRMADSRSNTAYSQGGGAGYAAAGGGVSAEKSADLGFLANLLPKPQDEMGKNGILDYGTAGRSPASMAPYSFLGKDVNIFQRISDRTTTKLKSGDVGGSNVGGS